MGFRGGQLVSSGTQHYSIFAISRTSVVVLTTQVRAGLIRMCGVVHTSIKVFADKFYEELVRRVYTTPKSYLDLINSYTAKLGVLQGAVETKAQQMEVSGEGGHALCSIVWCTVSYSLLLFS